LYRLAPRAHTHQVNRWLDRRAAWEYALIGGTGTWLLLFLGVMVLRQVAVLHAGLSFLIIRVSIGAVSATAAGTWERQRRLRRRSSRQRYSEPGPMLPYDGQADKQP
jgi:hypothetical protein